jgi:hypothetical protein
VKGLDRKTRRVRFYSLIFLLAACSPTDLQNSPSAPSSTVVPLVSAVPRISNAQAQGAATVVHFLDAYNERRLDVALVLLTEDVRFSDCDFGTGVALVAEGREQARMWLLGRFADHDVLMLSEIEFGKPNAVGSFGAALTVSRRTSDTLTRLGLREGITPELATKVVLTPAGDRLMAFANGPSRLSGPHPKCRVG